MSTVAKSTAGEHRLPERISMLTYGLIFGPALGMLIALIFFSGEALAQGLVIGSGLGVTIGVLLDSEHEHRTQDTTHNTK